MKNCFVACFLLFLLITGISCSKSNSNSAANPTSAKLIGTIQTFDDKIISTNDGSGILVTIPNTGQSTTTDVNGKFAFENLPFDLYDFEISKPGYGTYKVFGFKHAFNATQSFSVVPTIGFGKISTTSVTSLSLNGNTIDGLPGVTFNYNLSPVPSTSSKAFVRYFLSTSASVSSTNYMAYSGLSNFSNLSNITGFSVNDLTAMGFKSGETVYIRLYGDSFKSNDYEDPNTGTQVFPNINPNAAPAVSVVVP